MHRLTLMTLISYLITSLLKEHTIRKIIKNSVCVSLQEIPSWKRLMGQTQNIKQKWKVLVVNQTYTKMLNYFIRLFPRLSEKIFFCSLRL